MTEEHETLFLVTNHLYEFVKMMVEDTMDFQTAADVLEFLEKPYKWDDDLLLWEKFGKPHEGDEKWDDFFGEFAHSRGL
jgi:hypothetical protein